LILDTILDTVTEFRPARRIRTNIKNLTLPITITIEMGTTTTVVVLETKSFTNDLIEKDSCAVIRMVTVVGGKHLEGASAINCWWDQVKDLININLQPNLASTILLWSKSLGTALARRS